MRHVSDTRRRLAMVEHKWRLRFLESVTTAERAYHHPAILPPPSTPHPAQVTLANRLLKGDQR